MMQRSRLGIIGVFLILFGLLNLVVFGIFLGGTADPAFLWMAEIAILGGFALLFLSWDRGAPTYSPAQGPRKVTFRPSGYAEPVSNRDPLENVNDALFGKPSGSRSQGGSSMGGETTDQEGDALAGVNDYLYGTDSHRRSRDEGPRSDEDAAPRRDPLDNINDYLLGKPSGGRSRRRERRSEDDDDGYDYDDGGDEEPSGRDPLDNINDYLFGRK
jgi:hypothetical protein